MDKKPCTVPGTRETLKQPECSVPIQVHLKYRFLTVWATSKQLTLLLSDHILSPAGLAPDTWHGLIELNWNFQFCLELVPLCKQTVWYQSSAPGRKRLFGHGYSFLKCRMKRDQQDISVKYLIWTFLFICSFMHSQPGVPSWSIWLLSCTECKDSKEGIPVDS